jgi:hypothetical protein
LYREWNLWILILLEIARIQGCAIIINPPIQNKIINGFVVYGINSLSCDIEISADSTKISCVRRESISISLFEISVKEMFLPSIDIMLLSAIVKTKPSLPSVEEEILPMIRNRKPR